MAIVDLRPPNTDKFKVDPSTGQIEAVFNSTVGTDYHTTLKPGYLCRAWVNFDGTAVTSPASSTGIRASGNVSSILDNAIGDYTVYFTEAMPDTNYVINLSGRRPTISPGFVNISTEFAPTISGYRIVSADSAASPLDFNDIYSAVFR